jgi:hypothetical protein
MPIFEFYSPDTNKIYSFLARRSGFADRTPRCPDNPAFRMQKRVSSFSAIRGATEKSDDTADSPGMDDPRMERAMAELEREMPSLDSNNPDPRHMGRLMRRMAELTGQKIPGPMREMIERMERGEDPEKLEEEFGGLMDEEGEDFMGGEDVLGGEGEVALARAATQRRKPARDPRLFEMSDYLD